jgi:sulfite reductase (NADPH) flavoprotein alpha-component
MNPNPALAPTITPVPFIPEHAPFSPEQRAWLNGFLAGMFSRVAPALLASAAPPAAAALSPLAILFGSQTGTAETLAKKAAKLAADRGFAPTVVDMAQTPAIRLAGEKNLLILTSTYGDGEPPDNARALWAALGAEGAPALAGVRYSVCGLGDTNYVQFCQCGKDFDARLEKLGATRVAPRADCDLDYEGKFAGWLNAALAGFAAATPPVDGASPGAPAIEPAPATEPVLAKGEGGYTRSNPFPAHVLGVQRLNAPGSGKEVNHVALSLEGSGLAYDAGDALGVLPQNCPGLVADVLAALACDGEEAVPAPDGSTAPLRLALTEHYCLGKPAPELLSRLAVSSLAAAGASASPAPAPAPLDVLDALRAASDRKPGAAEFVRCLRKLQPRLYSIASSPQVHAGQVHLTVGAVRYENGGRLRKGACSTFLAERALGAGAVKVYVHANRAFRPPEAGTTAMIMVGPGTGIAPFRAFLHERRAQAAPGKNWLFFGDQRSATDFLYREELAELQRAGVLTRLDTAFSRDQAEKVYVQHRMQENAAELFAWLEAGAHFYVCGDASRMAKDVDAALHRVVEQAGARTAAQAADYVQALRAAKRYVRDVY